MAKIVEIKDERILKEVRDIQGDKPETKDWTPDKQMKLIWNLFRTNPKLKFAAMSKEEVVAAFKQWESEWNNGRLAYPSNTARSLAAGKLAAAPSSEEFVATDGIK